VEVTTFFGQQIDDADEKGPEVCLAKMCWTWAWRERKEDLEELVYSRKLPFYQQLSSFRLPSVFNRKPSWALLSPYGAFSWLPDVMAPPGVGETYPEQWEML
jgi:hypothetical protein